MQVKKFVTLLTISLSISYFSPAKADFGDADFPVGLFSDSPKSYHDAFCRKINNKCRVRFQKSAMWVEGQGGIQTSQLVGYRYDRDYDAGGPFSFGSLDHLNYITYRAKNGEVRQALFIFVNGDAQGEFMRAFLRWRKQTDLPVTNYRLPSSQGPQETHGRDKGLNPYENPPIEDWKIKTTEKESKGKKNCNSPVWKNKPICKS